MEEDIVYGFTVSYGNIECHIITDALRDLRINFDRTYGTFYFTCTNMLFNKLEEQLSKYKISVYADEGFRNE